MNHNIASVATLVVRYALSKNVNNKIETCETPKFDCHSLSSSIYTDDNSNNGNNISKILENN